MRTIHLTPLAATAATVLSATIAVAQETAAPATDDAWAPHRGLKVLYAGYPEGSREAAFESFLGRWFDTVETIHLKHLSMQTAQDFDVVIADWMSQYGNDGYPARENSLYSAPANLAADFTKPVIAMTYVGTQIRGEYKLDWL